MLSSYIFVTGTNSKRNTKIYHLIVLFVIIFVPCQILESDLRTCLILQLWWSVWIQVTDSLPARQHLSCGAVCRFLAAQTSPKLNKTKIQICFAPKMPLSRVARCSSPWAPPAAVCAVLPADTWWSQRAGLRLNNTLQHDYLSAMLDCPQHTEVSSDFLNLWCSLWFNLTGSLSRTKPGHCIMCVYVCLDCKFHSLTKGGPCLA